MRVKTSTVCYDPVIRRCCISASLPSPFALQPSLKEQSHAAGLNYKREGSKCPVCVVGVRDQGHPPSDSFYMCTDLFRLTSIAFNDVDMCASVHKRAGASAGQRGWLPPRSR